MSSAEKPSEWCRRMIDAATNGTDAMNYFELMKMWESRGL